MAVKNIYCVGLAIDKTRDQLLADGRRKFVRACRQDIEVTIGDGRAPTAKMIGAFAADQGQLDFFIGSMAPDKSFSSADHVGIVTAAKATVRSKQDEIDLFFFACFHQR